MALAALSRAVPNPLLSVLALAALVVRAASETSSGYLYSVGARSFIGIIDKYLVLSNVPSPFIIHVHSDGTANLEHCEANTCYSVLHDTPYASPYTIQMNESAHIRFMSDGMCETVMNNKIYQSPCNDSNSQSFLWVPIDMLSPSPEQERSPPPEEPPRPSRPREQPLHLPETPFSAMPSPRPAPPSPPPSPPPNPPLLTDSLAPSLPHSLPHSHSASPPAVISKPAPLWSDAPERLSHSPWVYHLPKHTPVQPPAASKPAVPPPGENGPGDCIKNSKNGQCFYVIGSNGTLVPLTASSYGTKCGIEALLGSNQQGAPGQYNPFYTNQIKTRLGLV